MPLVRVLAYLVAVPWQWMGIGGATLMSSPHQYRTGVKSMKILTKRLLKGMALHSTYTRDMGTF